jgi:hypothetical protein
MNREFLVVEYRFDPPATDALFEEHGHKLEPCLAARHVEWVHSYISADRRRRLCIFHAADAETVREAYRSAGVEFERIWNGTRLQP